MSGDYQLVQLANGEHTLFSARYGEKMHPGLGPVAEAEVLYVRQLKIRERLAAHAGEFVIWDVGLGSAANAAAALRATYGMAGNLRLVSFDNTAEPLEFALRNAASLPYLHGYESQVAELLKARTVEFSNGQGRVQWDFHCVDFPAWIAGSAAARNVPAPHAIFYDAFSPAKNPAMWSLPVFKNLFAALAEHRPCALTTYSRSTMIRATLLLAGFFVGVGHATGRKEETTIAANSTDLIDELLDTRWLERAERSDSAEPLQSGGYIRSRIRPETLEALRKKGQFLKVGSR